jgi:hypothetical protein
MAHKIDIVKRDAKTRKQILLGFVAFCDEYYYGDVLDCLAAGHANKLEGHPLFEDALGAVDSDAEADAFLKLFWQEELDAQPRLKYPHAMVTWLKRAYTIARMSLERIAQYLGKTIQSVRMKLVKMHLYQKPA